MTRGTSPHPGRGWSSCRPAIFSHASPRPRTGRSFRGDPGYPHLHLGAPRLAGVADDRADARMRVARAHHLGCLDRGGMVRLPARSDDAGADRAAGHRNDDCRRGGEDAAPPARRPALGHPLEQRVQQFRRGLRVVQVLAVQDQPLGFAGGHPAEQGRQASQAGQLLTAIRAGAQMNVNDRALGRVDRPDDVDAERLTDVTAGRAGHGASPRSSSASFSARSA